MKKLLFFFLLIPCFSEAQWINFYTNKIIGYTQDSIAIEDKMYYTIVPTLTKPGDFVHKNHLDAALAGASLDSTKSWRTKSDFSVEGLRTITHDGLAFETTTDRTAFFQGLESGILYTYGSTDYPSTVVPSVFSSITSVTGINSIAVTEDSVFLSVTNIANNSRVRLLQNEIKFTNSDLFTPIVGTGYTAPSDSNLVTVGIMNAAISAAGGINNVVEDTSPQLGGNLDLNTFTVGAATAADLTKLNGITSTATELNYTNGVTSAIQAQLGDRVNMAVQNNTITYEANPWSLNHSGNNVFQFVKSAGTGGMNFTNSSTSTGSVSVVRQSSGAGSVVIANDNTGGGDVEIRRSDDSAGDVILRAQGSGNEVLIYQSTDIDNLSDSAGVNKKGLADYVGQAIDTLKSSSIIREEIINLGAWNMSSATGSLSLAVDVTSLGIPADTAIISVEVSIIHDEGAASYQFFDKLNVAGSCTVCGSINPFSSATTITINNESGGFFDSTTFDRTDKNRGYMIVKWREE